MRNVLLVGPYPPPFGGPGVHMLHLQRWLGRRGVACQVLNIGANRRARVDGALPVRSGAGFVLEVARHALRGFHVHHFFNAESPKGLLLAAAAAVTSRFCRGTYSIAFIGGPRQTYLEATHSTWRTALRVATGLAEVVICNNPHVVDALAALGAERRKLRSIECFFEGQVSDIGDLTPAEVEFFREHRPSLVSVTHARFETAHPCHEMEVLVQALQGLRERYPRVGCVIVGGGSALPTFQGMARAAGIERHLLFAGELPHRRCLAVIRTADVFVRAYVKDGSSSSVREALALGVPTVAVANPQHPAAVISFRPRDGAHLAAVLVDVLERLEVVRAEIRERGVGASRSMDQELALLLGDAPRARSQ